MFSNNIHFFEITGFLPSFMKSWCPQKPVSYLAPRADNEITLSHDHKITRSPDHTITRSHYLKSHQRAEDRETNRGIASGGRSATRLSENYFLPADLNTN